MKIQYELNENEINSLKDWLSTQHIDDNHSPINGQITFCLTETTIGTSVTVRNNITREEFDITDYSIW